MMDDLESDSSQVTSNQIIKGLLTEDDLDVKTEIWNPLAAATIGVLATNIDKVLQQKVTAKDIKDLIGDWHHDFKKYMVSYKRQSRKEVVQAVTNVKQDESAEFAKSLLDRALGSQK